MNTTPTPEPTPQGPGPAAQPGIVSTGWLAANSTFEHKDDRKLFGAFGASLALHGGFLLLAILALSVKPVREIVAPPPIDQKLVVHLQAPGPGGGGGGAPAPAAPKPMEIPKPKAPDPIPVTPPPPVPVPVPEPPPQPVLNAPVMTTNAEVLQATGVNPISLASYGGGGRGRGVGPGTGNGVGPGEGGGFGGGAFRPGNGVTTPEPMFKAEPKYTSEAMRAKIQGEVWIDVVVLENGTVGDMKIVKSLDRTFGLDQEALKAAKLWRFRPGSRQGAPAQVIVTLILEFRLH